MYCCKPFFSHVILQNLIICRITWVFSLKLIDQSAKNYAHNTFLCQNRAFNDTHSSLYQPRFEVLCTNTLHANVYKTILQRFMQYISGIKHATQLEDQTCNTARRSSMQHSSDIEPVTHLGYQTHATRAYDELRRCLIRILTRFKWETQCKDYTQCRFYAEPIRKAGFARNRNAGFIWDPYAMRVLHGTSPIPQVFYDPLQYLPKHLGKLT